MIRLFNKLIDEYVFIVLCLVIVSPPVGEWADLAGTAIASQPVRWAEQAPNYISSSKNQGDNRRRM